VSWRLAACALTAELQQPRNLTTLVVPTCSCVQVSSFGDNPLLQPAAAQLANAMVAVLGPQFTLGSLAYSRCKTLVTDNTGGWVCIIRQARALVSCSVGLG
jgi:hypothetical protein